MAESPSGGAAVPSLLVSGTHSGVGKTTASFALMAALHARGYGVQPFKIGPDFIDTGYHRLATGRQSINLDLWMMGMPAIRRSVARFTRAADVALVEGMGALFDGENGVRERGSAGYFARQLGMPVLLVVDIWGMTRSTNAVIEGFLRFDPRVRIAGVLLNRAGGEKHYRMVRDGLAPHLRSLVIGYLPASDALTVRERHLGLLTLEENDAAHELKRRVAETIEKTCDLDRLVRVLGIRRGAASVAEVPARLAPPRVRLGIARDRAFCFYYPENLAALERAGAELVPFSPLADARLPDDLDGLYVGGGYPESFPGDLARNESLRAQIRESARAGMPIYAECGGLMYLGQRLVDFDGAEYPMAGVLPLTAQMDKEYLAIKYVRVRTLVDSILGPAGTPARGQEFHQSRLVWDGVGPNCYQATSSMGEVFEEGYVQGSVAASYVHLHFASNPSIPRHLVAHCLAFRKGRGAWVSDADVV